MSNRFEHFVILGFKTHKDVDKYFKGSSYKRIKGINGVTTDSSVLPKSETQDGVVGKVFKAYTQSQKDILESASSGFEEWQKEFIGTTPFHNGNTLWQLEAWQAAKISSEKEIQELKAQLKDTKEAMNTIWEANQCSKYNDGYIDMLITEYLKKYKEKEL